MVERGLDSLASRAKRASWLEGRENVRYLTGLRARVIAGKSAPLNGYRLFPEGEPVLLASGGEIQRALRVAASVVQQPAKAMITR